MLVKAEYDGELRRFKTGSAHIPSFQDLISQIRIAFPYCPAALALSDVYLAFHGPESATGDQMMLATSVYDAVEWQAATNWVGTITDASLKLKVIDASLPPVRPWNNAATPAPFSFIAPAPPVVAPIAPPVVPAAPRVAPPPPPQPFPRRFKHAHVHGGVQPKPHHHLHHHHHHPHRHHHSSRGPSRGPHSPPWPRRHKRAHLHDDLDLDLERGHDHSRERDFRPRRRWDAPLRSVSPPNRDDEPGSATAGNRRGYRVPSPSDSPVPRFLDELTDDDERHPIFPRTRPPLQPVVDLEASTRSHIFGNPMPVQRTSAHHSSTDLFPIQLPEISAPFPPMPGAFEFSTPAASTAQPVPVCESPALSARSPADGSTAAAVPAADPPCCNVDASRREIKGMMSDFLRNFSSVMGDSFATDIPPPPSPFIMPAVTVTTPASSSRSPMGMHIRSPVPAPAADVLPLHRNVWCDACGSSIRGTRYQCSVCPNYDLCGRCLGLGNIHPASHSFTSIEAPLPTPPATTPAPAPPTTHSELEYIIGRDIPVEAVDPNEPPSIHTSVYCDCCSEVIIGERSKCVDCNDYDLCSQCIVRMRDIHNPEHRFFTLVKPNRIVVHTVDDIFNPPARSPIVPAAPPVPAAPSIAEQDAADRELRDVSDYMSACSIMVRQIMEEAMSNITQTGVDRLAEQLTETAAGAEARINSVSEGVRGALGAARNVHAELEAAAATAREARDSLRTPAQRADALPVEHAATCNLCDSQVYGTRWKCLDCPDWDSCNACFAIVGEQHPSHRFVRVETKDQLPRPAGPARPEHDAIGDRHQATCDACDDAIYGVRYKCMHASCPDFDLCANCEALPIRVHPDAHPFLKLTSPEMSIPVAASPAAAHRLAVRALGPCHNASCDSCQQQIVGARYKCVEESCPDFDLCAVCEGREGPERELAHPTSHSMLKVSIPGGTIPVRAAPSAVSVRGVLNASPVVQQAIVPMPVPVSVPAVAEPAPGTVTERSPVRFEDAMRYLDLVKSRFKDTEPEVYNRFLDAMREFKSQQLDTHGVVKRVAELFNGQPDLIEGFNTFLPLPYHLRADERSTTLTEPNGTEISFPAEPQLPSVPATEVTVSDVGSPISTPHRLWEAENPFNDPSRPPSPVVNYPALEPVRVASPIAEPSPSTTNYQRFSQVWNPGFSRASDFAPRRSSPPPLVPDVANPFEDTESVPYLTPAEARAHFHGLDDFLKGYGAEEAEFNYMQPKPMPAPVPADASWSQWIPTPQPISRTPVDEAAERLYRQAVEEVEKEFELQRQQSEGEASSTSRDKGKRKMTQQEVRKLFEKEQNEVELEDVESDDKKRRTMSQDEVRRLFEQVPERSSPKLEEAPLPSPVLSPSLSPSPVPSPAPTAANPLAYATSSLFSIDPTWLPPISSSTSSSLNFSDLVARATEQLFPSVPQTEPVDSTMILPVEARTMEPEALPTTEDAVYATFPVSLRRQSRVPSVKASMPATFESANLSDSPTAAAPAATADLVATFISNNNIEDGHVFPAGAEFVKSWLMANEGTVAWPEATKLVYVAGFRMGNENAPMSYDIGVVAPGDRADVIVSDMKAPELPGHYIGFWRLSDGEGNFFGHRVWCDIVVTEPESSDSDDSLAASSVIMPAAAASLVATTVTEDAQSEIDAQTDAPTTPTVDSEIDTDSDASILDLSDDSDSEDDWDAGRRAQPQSSHGSSTLTVNNTNNGNTTTTTNNNNNNNRTGEQVEYVVLYDSASSADEA